MGKKTAGLFPGGILEPGFTEKRNMMLGGGTQ